MPNGMRGCFKIIKISRVLMLGAAIPKSKELFVETTESYGSAFPVVGKASSTHACRWSAVVFLS